MLSFFLFFSPLSLPLSSTSRHRRRPLSTFLVLLLVLAAPTDGKMKNNTVISDNKYIGNSITMDNRDVAIIENDYGNNKMAKRLEEDALSNNSLDSHIHRKLKRDSGSHKGSTETVDDGEEKRDASKEDFDDGMRLDGTLTSTLSSFLVDLTY